MLTQSFWSNFTPTAGKTVDDVESCYKETLLKACRAFIDRQDFKDALHLVKEENKQQIIEQTVACMYKLMTSLFVSPIFSTDVCSGVTPFSEEEIQHLTVVTSVNELPLEAVLFLKDNLSGVISVFLEEHLKVRGK